MPSRLRGVDGGPVSPQDLEDRVFTQVSHGHEDDDDDGDDDDDDSARRPGPCCSSAGCPRSPWCLSSSARRGPPSSPGTLPISSSS